MTEQSTKLVYELAKAIADEESSYDRIYNAQKRCEEIYKQGDYTEGEYILYSTIFKKLKDCDTPNSIFNSLDNVCYQLYLDKASTYFEILKTIEPVLFGKYSVEIAICPDKVFKEGRFEFDSVKNKDIYTYNNDLCFSSGLAFDGFEETGEYKYTNYYINHTIWVNGSRDYYDLDFIKRGINEYISTHLSEHEDYISEYYHLFIGNTAYKIPYIEFTTYSFLDFLSMYEKLNDVLIKEPVDSELLE